MSPVVALARFERLQNPMSQFGLPLLAVVTLK
jgi:hypothetical protein